MKDIRFLNATTGFLSGDTNYVFKSINGGLNWVSKSLPYSYPVKINAISFLNEYTGYAGGGHYSENYYYFTYLFKTTNCGENWIKIIDSQSLNGAITNINPINDSIVYISTSGVIEINSFGGVYKSINGGLSFSYMGIPYCCDAMHFINQNTGIVSNYYFTDFQGPRNRIYKTTNGCATWILQYEDSLSNATSTTKLQILNSNIIFGLGFNFTSNKTRFFSTSNGGNNWNYTEGSNARYMAMDFISPLTGWIGGYYSGDSSMISYTTNGGVNWSLQKKYYNATVNDIFFIDSLTGWAVLSNLKIMKTVTGGVTKILKQDSELPNNFSISQNYPNPFNPSTIIKFRIKETGFVTLKVYDLLGKKISTLINEKMPEGEYESAFDGSGLPSGVYFYKMTAGDYSETKKMILIK